VGSKCEEKKNIYIYNFLPEGLTEGSGLPSREMVPNNVCNVFQGVVYIMSNIIHFILWSSSVYNCLDANGL
jgi:hypothetical protein